MGEVYRARDTRLDRLVAVKVLRPQLAESPEFRTRLDREARAISRLNHPHICTLYDVGEASAENGTVGYLVMELLEGQTLAAQLAGGPLPIEQALTLAIQMASALHRAHRAGIVHGDLKPGNVMVTKAGAKLLDFGLALQSAPPLTSGWSHAETGAAAAAMPEQVFGSLGYVAPEQLEGQPADARSDVFGFGAVVYEMVTGRPAFTGATQAAVIAAVMRHAPPPPSQIRPGVPVGLDRLLAACLAKDPAERWQSAGDLAYEIGWLAEPAPPARRSRRPVTLWLAAATVVLVAALGGAAGWLARGRPAAAAVVRSSVLLPPGLRFPPARTIGGAGRMALSPDGRRLAFAAIDAHGNQSLWVRTLDTMAATQVVGTDGASSPFWSPGSDGIAFFAMGQLKTVDLTGAMPNVVASPAFDATGSWNRDGVILFTPAPNAPIHRVPATGGTASAVTALDAGAGDVLHRNPFFLPDGRHFLYVAVAPRERGATGPRALYVGSLDTSEAPRLLVDRGSIAMYAAGHLLFVRDNRLLAQPFDTGALLLGGDARPVAEQVAFVGAGSAAFSVSAAGTLAFQPSDTGSQLVWFDRTGRQLGAVGDPGEYGDVELSPDGRRVAVSVLDPVPNTRDLWLFDLDRGVRTRLTVNPADDVTPVWSPDGNSVLFASNRNGHFDLYRKAVDDVGAETPLMADGSEKYPTGWSSDGREALVWSFDADRAGLSLLMLAGEQPLRPLLNGFANAGRFSPDGRWLAYHSSESGTPEVYVVPYPTASRRWQVSSLGGTLPRWRADSKEIFYASRDNRLMAVAAEARDGGLDVGTPRALFEARPVGPRAFYAVSPDGQRFLVNTLQGDGPASITLVQNWSGALAP
jgi:eukaryotic-like serine/threonine-protein kinase